MRPRGSTFALADWVRRSAVRVLAAEAVVDGLAVVVDRVFVVDRVARRRLRSVFGQFGLRLRSSPPQDARWRPTSQPRGGSADRRAGARAGAVASTISAATTMTATETTWAVGTPKNVQLSARSVSSTNRTMPYQMKKIRSRSPARSRRRRWKPSQIRTSAPRTPEIDSYRNSGWKCGRLGELGRAGVRRDAVGAVDRDAPRQRRRRAVQLLVEEVAPAAIACIVNSAGRDDVGPAQERSVLQRTYRNAAIGAGDDPAVDPEAGIRRQDDLEQVVLVELPLVDDVVEPAADQRRDGDDDHPVADELGVLAGLPAMRTMTRYAAARPERIADPIPVHRDRAELDAIGFGSEVDHRASVTAGLPILRRAVNAEFNVWLLIVGLVVGAGLVWLVVMDSRRRESEVDDVERPREAAWISSVMIEDGYDVSPETVERLLGLHRAYLEAAPPDGVMGGDDEDVEEPDEVVLRPVGEATDAPPPAAQGVAVDE